MITIGFHHDKSKKYENFLCGKICFLLRCLSLARLGLQPSQIVFNIRSFQPDIFIRGAEK